jgi:cation transport ATPase
MSLILPSKASEMSSHLGETVKAWEPAIKLHVRVLFAPVIDLLDGFSFANSIEARHETEMWTQVFYDIAYWLPITLSGWLMLLYPLVNYLSKRITNQTRRRSFQISTLMISVIGTSFLMHHLFHWATLYEGYYHMGIGGYFVMLAFLALCALVLNDVVKDRVSQAKV